MKIFMLKSLSKDELSRRIRVIREKFRIQAGDAVYDNHLAGLPEHINNETLKLDVTPNSCLV